MVYYFVVLFWEDVIIRKLIFGYLGKSIFDSIGVKLVLYDNRN